MKIGPANTLSNYEVKPPPEIIGIIVGFIQYHDVSRTRTLSSCCLLSKIWYKAAVGPLYERPNLTNRNFDKFVRTICPPVNAHVRRTGLETLVRHLDMGRLAYESTNSLTARILRRTRMSLEVFVAPATSFSISSLAPLSKCVRLQDLDLSRDFYDISLGQLLNSIGMLPIRFLSLPRSAMQRPYQLAPKHPNGNTWPKTLVHLGINDWLPSTVNCWHELFESFPSSLISLAFNDCFNWHSFWLFPELRVTATNVRSVRIAIRREDGCFPIGLLLKVFPAVTSLSLPAPMIDMGEDITTQPHWTKTEGNLQYLTFTRVPNAIRQVPQLTIGFLAECVNTFPFLYRIDIPEAYLKLDEEDPNLEELEERMISLMTARATDGQASGLYLT